MPVAERKIWVQTLQARHRVSICLGCEVSGISRSAYYDKPKQIDETVITDLLKTLAEKHKRWGFPKLFKRIRALGHPWNHKRVYRLYQALKLSLRSKKKQRIAPRNPEPLHVPDKFGNTWSMDFMSDTLETRVRYRTFNVIDDSNREVLGIDIGIGMPAQRVVRYLDE